MKISSFIEVVSLDELPIPPQGNKYFTCIGGKKNYQCFLENDKLSRKDFMERYEGKVDKCLWPVYKNNNIVIRQDPVYAVPGLFIISTRDTYRTIADVPYQIYRECMNYVFTIYDFLSRELDILDIYFYYDEHICKPSSAHIWVIPIYNMLDSNRFPSIIDGSIWHYLKSFCYSDSKHRINNIVDKLRDFINA